MKKILVVVIIILFSFSIFYLALDTQRKEIFKNFIKGHSKTLPRIENDYSKDWKQYTNKKYGFSFKYPAYLYDVTAQLEEGRGTDKSGESFALDKNSTYERYPSLSLGVSKSRLSAEEFAKDDPISELSDSSYIRAVNTLGYIHSKHHQTIGYRMCYFSDGNYVVMLSSVDVANSSNVDGWTYNNEDFMPELTRICKTFEFD